VRQILQNVHYLLMPSRFLETFGLSALESIESGVPVIAPNKGGLRQFLLSEHAIEGQNGAQESQAFLRKVQEIQNRFSGSDWKRQSNTARDIAARFSQAAWLENALSLIPAGSRILFVTDYGAPLGGIESWISGSRKLLEMANCTTDCIASTNTSTTWMRQIHLLFSTANWWFAWRLARKIRTYKPDYIWL
jgi:glycogen synthase